jgi:stalled ribosome rescue protein Dom34
MAEHAKMILYLIKYETNKMQIVVIDGISAYFYSIDGNGQIINHGKINYQFPPGSRYAWGQKSRNEIRKQQYMDNCVKKIEEIFGKPIKDKTLHLAGPGSVKTHLKHNLSKVSKDWENNTKLVDVQYGGENGVFQACQKIYNPR